MTDENRPCTVMVVDDTPANLELLGNILRAEGLRVLQFPRGAMALRAALQSPPDLFLLDVMMPDMDGFEVCRRIKESEALREIPVVFISALDDTASKIKAFASGGVDYVAKPFHKEEVLARVNAQIRIHRQQIEIDSRRKLLQESYDRLQSLEIHRDQLVHMIVHDMRSPLMGIAGFAELLFDELRAARSSELASYAETVLASSRVLQELISTLLDVSRMESNQMPLSISVGDLFPIAEKALATLGSMTQQSSVSLVPPPGPVLALCDPDVTGRIFQNLVANAIKFAGTSGSIEIRIGAEPDSGPWFEVADNGPGIPPEFHERVFEKFGQVNSRLAGHKFSTGLGLTFCRMAAEAQGGSIRLSSQVGVGTTFRVALPPPPAAP